MSTISCLTSKFCYGSRFRQYFTAFTVNLSVMSAGTVLVWPATAVPHINDDVLTAITLSSREVAWITSASSLAGLAACPIMGFYIQKLGLRRSMLTLTLPLIMGWILIIFSKNFGVLLAGRLITGFCSGGMTIANPVFIAETSDVEIRGLLGYSFDIMFSFGQLYIYVIGAYVSWVWQSVACIIIPILFYILMLLIPESPRDLISKGKFAESKKALAWFKNSPSLDLIQPEFDSILKDFKESETSKLSLHDYYTVRVWKPTFMCIMLVFFNAACGSFLIVTYTVQIFENVHVTHSYLATILIGISEVLVAIAAAIFVDRVGRRILLILSGLGMGICLFALGGYLHWEAEFGNFRKLLPVPILMLYIVLFSIGFGPIPWVLMGEMIPSRAKGFASAITIAAFRLTAFAVLFLFNDMAALMGLDMTFCLFGVISILGAAYGFLQIPETMNMTLNEIQQLYM